MKSCVLLCGDCVSTVNKSIRKESIDLIITSPPYDDLRTYNNPLDWDFHALAQALTRVLKPGGVIVWVVGDATKNGSETLTSMRQAIYFKDVCGLNVHDTMIYQTNKPPLSHNRYEQTWEYMFVFSKGRPKTWNPLKETAKMAGKSRRGITMRQDSDDLGPRCGKGRYKDEKIPTNIWFLPRGAKTDGEERKAHPATFPLELARRHILTWTNEGDVILDPFVGSGTTCIAAQELNRHSIGIDISEEYIELAKSRLGKLDA